MIFRRLSAAIAVVALLSCLPQRGYAADDADAAALLAKHHAYVGWQLGDGSIQSLRIKATYANAEGKKAYTFTELHRGLIDRTTNVDLRHEGILTDDGFTGSLFWRSDENGFTTPQLGESAKFELAWRVLFSEATTELPGVARGPQDVDGKTTQVVRVTMKNGESIDLYEDPATGAYVQAVISPEGQRTATVHILAYADALPGKKIISSYRIGKSRYTTADTKIEANVTIADADFHPPAPRATWTFANPAPFPLKATDKRFIVDAKVNGVPGRFIIDTGADGIYLTSAFAKRAKVKPFSTSQASGIGGTAKTEVDRIDALELGGNTLSNAIAYSGGDSFDEDAPDGLIGFSLFGGAVVSMDSTDGQIAIADPATTAPDHNAGVVLNVDLQNGVPQVPMKINGSIDVNATLDSGNFYYVLFGKDLITSHGLKMLVDNSDIGAIESHPELGGVGGYEADRCGHIDSIALGPIVYQNAPACESPSFENREILIGFDYLRHFNFVFDYPHGQLVMTPHKE
jgi:predicted aspartyl protease